MEVLPLVFGALRARHRRPTLSQGATLVSTIVYVYDDLYGRPLLGKTWLKALLAVMKYLKPDGTVRARPLNIEFDFYLINPQRIESSHVDEAIEEALKNKAIEVADLIPCYNSLLDCDTAQYNIAYRPGEKRIEPPPELYEIVLRYVERFAGWKPSAITSYLLTALGFPPSDYLGAHVGGVKIYELYKARRRCAGR